MSNMQITTHAEIDEVSLEFIASIVQTELIQAAVIGGTIDDYTIFASPGGDSCKVPRTGSFVVQKKGQGQKVDPQKLTFGADKISFTEEAVIQAIVEDTSDIQSSVPVTAEYLRRMASAHALQIDKDIFAQLKLAGLTSAYKTGTAPTAADFDLANKLFRKAHIPNDGRRSMLIGADREEIIQGLPNFVDADKWMEGSSVAKLEAMFPGGQPGTGFLGRIKGWNVYSSTIVPDSDNGMYFYHSSHVGIGFQRKPRIQEQYKLEYLGNLVSMDQLYGVKVLDSGARGLRIGA